MDSIGKISASVSDESEERSEIFSFRLERTLQQFFSFWKADYRVVSSFFLSSVYFGCALELLNLK